MSKQGDGGSSVNQYGIPAGATDLQDLIEHRDMSFAVGNIFKACYRLGIKNDTMYELNKIKWFVQRLIDSNSETIEGGSGTFNLTPDMLLSSEDDIPLTDTREDREESCSFMDGGYCYNPYLSYAGCIGVASCPMHRAVEDTVEHTKDYYDTERNR